eukprot:CAMPEP_0184656750 /NCGR_PEP_ID=MMETSP0308-20130426/16725_1 /TAXON_ID=38269 /ORGANISM="Gloeochaete witrockiana, Strain SAG 46.84" /LENGTH=123 /DNA_ID=CAMNT_0027094011 /DNA_START=153 /DNA_END=524 /DNA_ORIENTATION=-
MEFETDDSCSLIYLHDQDETLSELDPCIASWNISPGVRAPLQNMPRSSPIPWECPSPCRTTPDTFTHRSTPTLWNLTSPLPTLYEELRLEVLLQSYLDSQVKMASMEVKASHDRPLSRCALAR